MAIGQSLEHDTAAIGLTVSRVVDAPRLLVFRAWTDPQQVARWWGPKGFVTTHCEMDIRPNGSYRVGMRSPDGVEYWKVGTYHEISAPERIIFTFAWEDPDGRPVWQTLVTVTFDALGDKTRLTLSQAGFDTTDNRDSHTQGWTSCLERFAEYMVARS